MSVKRLSRLGRIVFLALTQPLVAWSNDSLSIPAEFTEPYGGGNGIRFKIRNLQIEDGPNILRSKHGGKFRVAMDVLQDCQECDPGAINQVIVGIAGQNRAQVCVWNGFSTPWLRTSFRVTIPDSIGNYYIRTRYAQAFVSRDALNWWKVDRPNGPDSTANIGLIIVESSLGG